MMYAFYVDNFYITSYELSAIKTDIAERLAKQKFSNDYDLISTRGITIKRRGNS